MADLDGKRVLVLGASSGVGRACGAALVRHGAHVVFTARRADRLAEAVEEAGGGHAVSIDVTDQASINRGVAEAVQHLGGFDVVLYVAGMSPLASLRKVSAEQLQQIFAVNTFGPIHVFAACLPHAADDAIFAAVSSDSSHQPRHSLVPYAASKAALEATMEGWRTEELGGRRFMTVLIGPTQPTEFAVNFTEAEFMEVIPHWGRQGFRTGMQLGTDVGEHLAVSFASLFRAPTLGVETLLLRAPEPATPLENYGVDNQEVWGS